MMPATDILNAHLSPFLLEQHSTLSSGLKTIEESNRALVDTIVAQRAEMQALISGLEAVVQDLESSATMLQQDSLQGLSGEIGMIEQELKG
jgi:kinetochore protein NNF1